MLGRPELELSAHHYFEALGIDPESAKLLDVTWVSSDGLKRSASRFEQVVCELKQVDMLQKALMYGYQAELHSHQKGQ